MPEMYSFWWWITFSILWGSIGVIPAALNTFYLIDPQPNDTLARVGIVLNSAVLGPIGLIVWGALIHRNGGIPAINKAFLDREKRKQDILHDLEKREKERKKEEKRYSVETTHKRQIRLKPVKTGWRKYI